MILILFKKSIREIKKRKKKEKTMIGCNVIPLYFQVFPSDMGTITQPLPDPATCRFVRLHPMTYKVHPCLKLELHGCVPWWQRTYFKFKSLYSMIMIPGYLYNQIKMWTLLIFLSLEFKKRLVYIPLVLFV